MPSPSPLTKALIEDGLRPRQDAIAHERVRDAAHDLLAALKRNRAALDLIDPMRPLQYATTMDLMRRDMDAAIAVATGERQERAA